MTAPFPDEKAMCIERDGLALRAMVPADAARVAALAGDIRVAGRLALVPSPWPVADAEAWIASHPAWRAGGEAFHFAVCEAGSDTMIASVSLDAMEDLGPSGRQYDLGYWVAPDAWGRGLATRAASAVRDWAFGVLKAGRLTSSCLADNPASQRVLEKTGFLYLDTRMKLRPARGTQAFVESFRLDRPRWESLVRHTA